MSATPQDALSVDAEIKALLAAHPGAKIHISGGTLDSLDAHTKRVLLGDLKRALGITTPTGDDHDERHAPATPGPAPRNPLG